MGWNLFKRLTEPVRISTWRWRRCLNKATTTGATRKSEDTVGHVWANVFRDLYIISIVVKTSNVHSTSDPPNLSIYGIDALWRSICPRLRWTVSDRRGDINGEPVSHGTACSQRPLSGQGHRGWSAPSRARPDTPRRCASAGRRRVCRSGCRYHMCARPGRDSPRYMISPAARGLSVLHPVRSSASRCVRRDAGQPIWLLPQRPPLCRVRRRL